MIIKFDNKKIQQLCLDYKVAKREFGSEKIANALAILMTDMDKAIHILDFQHVPKLKKYKMHELIGKDKGTVSMSVDYSYRLTLTVEIVNVGEIEDEIRILEVSKHYGN